MNHPSAVFSGAVLVGGPVLVPRSPADVASAAPTASKGSELVRKTYETGFAEGVQAGREQGLAEGREAAAAEFQSARKAMAAAVAGLDDERRRLAAELEQNALGLALAVARKMVHAELVTNAEAAARVVQAAAEHARDATIVRVRIHPSDRERIGAVHPGGLGFELAADPSVAEGGCVVETECGEVDATVASRWEAVMGALKEATAAVDAPDAQAQQLADTIDRVPAPAAEPDPEPEPMPAMPDGAQVSLPDAADPARSQ